MVLARVRLSSTLPNMRMCRGSSPPFAESRPCSVSSVPGHAFIMWTKNMLWGPVIFCTRGNPVDSFTSTPTSNLIVFFLVKFCRCNPNAKPRASFAPITGPPAVKPAVAKPLFVKCVIGSPANAAAAMLGPVAPPPAAPLLHAHGPAGGGAVGAGVAAPSPGRAPPKGIGGLGVCCALMALMRVRARFTLAASPLTTKCSLASLLGFGAPGAK
mmetsp:Transcript_30109/g.56262  ORF Transcript_30109/g.56262 Transcript_30109/m.56262 type:complete len:213 (-) Transcript_30109:355-993(-)